MLTSDNAAQRRAKPPKLCAEFAARVARALRQRVRQADVTDSMPEAVRHQRNGSRRIRIPRGLMATMAPAARSAANVSRFMRSTFARPLAGSVDTSRVNTTEGDEARCAAKSMPKSVSDEMITDASVRTLEDFDVFGHR